jgi:esterase/lipase superfamily enzyme
VDRTQQVLLVLVLAFLAGCQSQLMLMPTPEVLKDERFNLFEANPDPMTSNEIATLYVTTRVPDERRADFFRGTPDERLHFGYAELRIGEENLNLFELINQSTTGERQEKYGWNLLSAPILSSTGRPSEATNPDPILPESMAESIAALNDYIDENPIKELTIYAHGANNTFYWSVAQGAQFQYFTGDNAMVLTFAWPSPGSIWGYGTDKRRANAAATDLAYLIELLAHHSTATRINLIAYSAGGRVVGRALAELAERYQDRESLRLGQVYLTQSDQPLAEFVDDLPDFFPLVEGLTVTAAVGDPVLGMARITDRELRLGATGEGDAVNLNLSDEHYQQIVEIMNSEKMVFIDLREVPATEYRFTHGAWYDSSWVSTDVMVTLLGGLTAEERGLVPHRVNDVRIWLFPDDYVERVKDNILNRPAERRKVATPDS